MANRRLFSKNIFFKSAFITMPLSAQALYFYFMAEADDDGICGALKPMRVSGASEDDLKILVAKGFLVLLDPDERIYWIKDWHEHNTIRSTRKADSIYKHLLIEKVPGVEQILVPDERRKDSARRVQARHDQQEENMSAADSTRTDVQSADEVKLSKDKLSKDNIYSEKNKKNEPYRDFDRFQLNDGSVAVMRFGTWCDANPPHNKLDIHHYKELPL